MKNSIRFTQLFLENPVKGTQALYKNLSMMSRESEIPYITSNINTIVQWANDYGGAAKPSGAGGGDCVVAFFDEPEQRRSFIEKINSHPVFFQIGYEISEGVHVVKNRG